MLDELEKDPKEFGYFQALRLLWLANQDRFPTLRDLINRGLIIQGSPDLAFPTSDLTEIERLDSGSYRLTVTFMGLAGSCSPLPPFYAQQILDDTLNEDYGSSQLVNLIALPSYRRHAEAFFHNNVSFRLLEEKDPSCWTVIHALLGLGHSGMEAESHMGDLAYMGLLATQTRTAEGLLAFVAGQLKLKVTELTECVLRWVAIPVNQRLTLGGDRNYRALGASALGRAAQDVQGQFTMTIPVEDPELFERLKPEGELRLALEKAVDRYLTSPLVYCLKILLKPGVAPGVRLGQVGALGRWACLSPPAEEIVFHSLAKGDRAGFPPHQASPF
ncbi:MAG: type VI secretion system baseplate subunit TssG [Deltaproteobacteria bacterium]|jgi:type VI secretion system protein ImpH|nr:type VI secretion system baseplate subunit TssG [Deltaproteobacteria bacterium]